MSVWALAVWAAAVTLILSLLLPLLVKPLLVRLGIMDVPSARSSHDRPVLRGLGLAVLIAVAAGGGSTVILGATGVVSGAQLGWQLLLVVVLGACAAGVIGLAEDLSGLSVRARSVCLVLLGFAAPLALFWASSLTLGGDAATGRGATAETLQWGLAPSVSFIDAGVPWWVLTLLACYAMLFISSYINVANFMDGLNGISGFHGVIAGLTFAVLGLLTGLGWLCAAGLILAAGFGGFLPWNLSKPGAFLGDVGSYLLGGSVAITSFAALISGVPFLATIGPMVIYFGDVGVTLVQRIRAGKRWDEPHKEHAYQRLQQTGLSHIQASAFAAAASTLTALLGVASLWTGLLGTLLLFASGLLVLLAYLALPRLIGRRGRG